MKRLVLLASVMMAACSQQATDVPPPQQPVFEGNVTGINGDGNEGMMRFSMTFTEPDENGIPQRFWISSGCIDTGYFDAGRQIFVSGHSPAAKASNQETADRNRERRCPSDHYEIFQRLLDLTYEGFVLEIDEPRARLTTPSGRSIELARNPMAHLAH